VRSREASWQKVRRGGRAYRVRRRETPHYTLAVYELLARATPAPPRPAAVLIHGLEEGWEIWEPLAERLAQRLRVFCLDLPWSGRSRYDWADDTRVRSWIARGLALVPGPVSVVVAHSFGASALLEHFDARGPGSIEAAVLMSPFYRGRQEFSWALFEHYMGNFPRFLEAGIQARRPAVRESSEPDAVLARKVFALIGPRGCLQFLNLFARTPRLELAGLDIPFLLLGGGEDFYSLPADCEALRRALPRAEARLLPGCGHFAMIEQPEVLSSLMVEFLDRSLRSRLRERREDPRCLFA
jgi:pimeloyl-ACP methyl ester carboxylesterase